MARWPRCSLQCFQRPPRLGCSHSFSRCHLLLGSLGVGQSPGESPARTCPHMQPWGVWPPPARLRPGKLEEPPMPGAAQRSPHKPGSCQALMGGSPGRGKAAANRGRYVGGSRSAGPRLSFSPALHLNVSLFLSYLFHKVCPFLDIRSPQNSPYLSLWFPQFSFCPSEIICRRRCKKASTEQPVNQHQSTS